MNTKDRIEEYLTFGISQANKKVLEAKLLDGIIDKLSFKDLLSLKNNLIDDKFKSIMEDNDLSTSIEEFFKYDLNIAETSRNSFLHRNTLLYRLNKIANLTGLNIRNFDDAIAFKVLSKIYNLTR